MSNTAGRIEHYSGVQAGMRNPNDAVNHPMHYSGIQVSIECIDITRWMPFNLGNAFKYIWRAGRKGSEEEDVKKAQWYVNDLLTNEALCCDGLMKSSAYPFRTIAMALMERIYAAAFPDGHKEELRRWTLQVLTKGDLTKASYYIQDWLSKLKGKTTNDSLCFAVLTTLGQLREEFVKRTGVLPDKSELMDMVKNKTAYSTEQVDEVLKCSNFALREEPK